MLALLALEADAQRLFERLANGCERPQRSLGLDARERVAGVRGQEPGHVLWLPQRDARVSARRRYSPKLLPKALAELCAVRAISQNARSVAAS